MPASLEDELETENPAVFRYRRLSQSLSVSVADHLRAFLGYNGSSYFVFGSSYELQYTADAPTLADHRHLFINRAFTCRVGERRVLRSGAKRGRCHVEDAPR
jgi:hypothetical protein